MASPANPLLEDFIPGVQYNGVQTKKNVTLGGNLDMSNSAGTFDGPTGATTFHGSVTFASGRTNPVYASSGNTSPTAAQSGGTFLFDTAAGITFTLPAPVVGAEYIFVVTASVTSSNHKVITNAGTVLLQGTILGATTTATMFESVIGTSNIAVTMNGSTTGGLVGTQLAFKCLSATLWQVNGMNFGSGSPATPFATS